tara:strand:- start:168 stop:1187 length:1020 start_codon:yes stop_codon:yes gene_type:complete
MERGASEKNLQVVTLHFNVPDHYLNVDEFIVAARSTEKIIAEINERLFQGKLKYELVVLPPEAGSLKERLGIKVKTAAALVILTAAGPELASGVIKGFTGKSIFEIGEMIGESVADVLKNPQEVWSESLVAVFLAEATKGFFEKKTKELENNGIKKDVFTKAYEARNEFYESCYRNPDIAGIGFDDTEDFPIHRDNFSEYIVEIPEREEEEDDTWEWEITYIKVISPNWDKTDTKRGWKAKYKDKEGFKKDEYKEAYFNIEDDTFWGLVDAEQLTLKGKDSIKVQWAYQKLSGRRKNFRVLKVLEYNGTELAKPLSDEDLLNILSDFEENVPEQTDMFG